jgi:PAS domain-containing protein
MYYHIPADDILSVNISKLNVIHHQSTTTITTTDNPTNVVTLSAALELSDKGRVICSACHPYPVLYANKAWSILTKYQQHEISGKTLSLLQGELTDLSAIQVMMHNVQYTGHGEAEVINYRQDGTPFFCSLKIQPLSSSDMYGELKITHLLGTYSIFDIDEKMKDLLKKKKEDEYSWLIQCDIIDEEQNTDTIKSIKRRRRQVYLETE